MQLVFDQLIPEPLREKLKYTASGIWNKSVTFKKGDYVFVQAPSGTGKTTLLHIMYGLRNDYTGTLQWGNNALGGRNEDAVAALRAGRVSIIFQDMRLFPELTAWENLAVKGALSNNFAEGTVIGWMERLGIAEKKNALAATMSYGEQQRLAILRALLQPFDWLLMDEPFSHLDHENTRKAIALIQEVVKQQGAGLLLADLDANNYFPYTQTILL